MAFFRRKRKHGNGYHSPPPPSDEIKRAVEDASITADIQLEKAESRQDEVERRTERLNNIRSANELGPRFWQAVGAHRSA